MTALVLADGSEVLRHILIDRLLKAGIVAAIIVIALVAMVILWRRS
ncbi:hypothetical protein P0W64_00440 [Tsukamurella sp. 8F]|nr:MULTISPECIES: hypothetical protein [unclassified Tsukamurella]MDF0531292.1 hypothetical protein [Tsukamurella sp. 8J]MDF0585241.1 hypothetical protein [Tsukamurella sp. 8F]